MRTAIDAWARQQPDNPPRAEAIRRMISQVLSDPLPSDVSHRIDVYAKHTNMSRGKAIATLVELALGPDKARY